MGPGIAWYDGHAEWVGFHHKTLASFLQAFGDTGLALLTEKPR